MSPIARFDQKTETKKEMKMKEEDKWNVIYLVRMLNTYDEKFDFDFFNKSHLNSGDTFHRLLWLAQEPH